ncbi:MAG: hypothetical protein VKJ85_00080, partial [Prochlorothrix sp.]|nr:hypothetical protein [Prochlorothrix sp.]
PRDSASPSRLSPQIQVTTTPPIAAIIANGEAVQFRVQVLQPDQSPLAPVRYHIQLHTPAATPWFSSDFPHTESSTLLELTATEADGVLEFEQILPIRGDYTLQVSASLDQLNPPLTLSDPVILSVPERSVRYRNAALWAVALLTIGLGGGWLIGGDPTVKAGEVAPQRVRLLLSGATVVAIGALLYVNVRAELGLVSDSGAGHGHAQGQGHTEGQNHGHDLKQATEPGTGAIELDSADPAAGLPAELALELPTDLEIRFLSRTTATIGTPAPQVIAVTDGETGESLPDLPMRLEIRDLEHDRRVFGYTTATDERGQVYWRSQFFDAADHQVMAMPGGTVTGDLTDLSGIKRQFMEIRAITPPLSVRLISLGYLMAFFGVGLAAGYGLHRAQRDRSGLISDG